ncbi:VTT domain-containing protein [Sanguibacter sp. 25GB23B1]|uniref:DedA family protein n=1 Tax=unclassified Sanguibacter TaxID=2645534 RepID=UPI0032AF9A25
MPDLDGAPFVAIFCFFFAVVTTRTQATYWLARLVVTQAVGRPDRTHPVLVRARAWAQSPSAARGIATLNRWGVVAVPLSFFTVGFKTVVNGAAGLTQMPFRRYLPAMLLGCLVHATIYATVGWAAWEAALAAAAGSPWGIAALASLLVGAAALVVVSRRRAARRRLPSAAPDTAPGQSAGDG